MAPHCLEGTVINANNICERLFCTGLIIYGLNSMKHKYQWPMTSSDIDFICK